MIKRLCRWVLREELFTSECLDALNERFSTIESKQYDDAKILQRHESLMRTLREDMRILQTRQVGLMNAMEMLKSNVTLQGCQHSGVSNTAP